MSATSIKMPISNVIKPDLDALRDCVLPIYNQQLGQVDDAWDRFNRQETRRGRDADVLTETQRTYLQNTILQTLKWTSMYQYAIDTEDIGPGLSKYEFRKNNTIPAPDITQTFEGGKNVVVTGTDTTVKLYGLHYDIHLDKVTLDAGNRTSGAKVTYSPTIQTNQIDEITRTLVDYWNHWVFWGSAYDGFTQDIGVLGICNYTGITNVSASDTTLTTAGDIVKLVNEMENGIIENKIFEGTTQVHLSPKVYSKAKVLRNATSGKTDMDYLREQYGAANIYNNPFIMEATSETTSTGCALVGKKLPAQFNKIAQAYPLAFYPKTSSDLGWDAKILTYGGVVLERPEAWAYESSLTTA
jgi:hypothetical protein